MNHDVTTHDEPADRLTRICDSMIIALGEHPESDEDDKCIVFLDDGKRGGMVLHGYEDTNEAIVDLFMHLRALFRASGKDLQFVGIPESPEGLT